MYCANSRCGRIAQCLFDGTLWFVELELPPSARIAGDGEGFPVCTVPRRYFWLCRDCSRSMKIRRWTEAGIVLAPRGGGVNADCPIGAAEGACSEGGSRHADHSRIAST